MSSSIFAQDISLTTVYSPKVLEHAVYRSVPSQVVQIVPSSWAPTSRAAPLSHRWCPSAALGSARRRARS